MPRWIPRAMLLALALIACFQLAHWAFIQLVGLLVEILVAFVLALAIEPAVDWLTRRHLRRGLATGVVFLLAVILVAGLLTAFGALVVEEISQLADQLPHYAESLLRWYNHTFHRSVRLSDLQRRLLSDSGAISNYVSQIANNAWGISSTVIGGVFKMFTIALFTFYFAADGPRLRRAVCSTLPPSRQDAVLRAWEIAVAKTGGYLYSRLVQAVISGIAHFLILYFLDVPYAVLLAIFAGVVSQFIPTIGTYIGGALPVLLALTVSPGTAVWVLIFEVGYQQVENYLIHPRVTAFTVDIHPAIAFGSVLVGAALLGAIGALIAIPVTATLQTFLGTYIRRYEVADPRVDEMTGRGRRRRRQARRPGQGRPTGSGGRPGGGPDDGPDSRSGVGSK